MNLIQLAQQLQLLRDNRPSVRALSASVLGDLLEFEAVDLNLQQLIVYKLADCLRVEPELSVVESLLNALAYCCYRPLVLPFALIKQRYQEFDISCRAEADVILECQSS